MAWLCFFLGFFEGLVLFWFIGFCFGVFCLVLFWADFFFFECSDWLRCWRPSIADYIGWAQHIWGESEHLLMLNGNTSVLTGKSFVWANKFSEDGWDHRTWAIAHSKSNELGFNLPALQYFDNLVHWLICKSYGLVPAAQDALVKDHKAGRSPSHNTDHATNILYFLLLSCSPAEVKTTTELPELTTVRKKWAAGVYGKGYLQWYRRWHIDTPLQACQRFSSRSLLPVFLQVLAHLVDLGLQVIPAKQREKWRSSLHWEKEVWFLQRLSLHRALSLLGAPSKTRESRIQMQYPNAQLSWATSLQNPLKKPAHKLLPAKLCPINPTVLFSATKAQNYRLGA